MGQFYTKTDDSSWLVGVPWTKVPSGWSRVRTAYRKTSATVWTSFYTADLAPPSPPTLTLGITGNTLKITVQAPANPDTYRVRVKVGKAVSVNNNTDANYIYTPDGADANWSDWLISPNQTRTKYYPADGSSLTAGSTYYVTAWTEDTSHNYSTPVSGYEKFLSTGVAAPESYTAILDPSYSKSWYNTSGYWDHNTDQYLRIGTPENRRGFLFYSTRMLSLLKGAKSITSMKVQIQRHPQWDYNGATQFHIFGHSLQNQPTTNPMSKILITDSGWQSANHGQTLQVGVPSSFFPGMLSGSIVGLGITSQQGSGDHDTDKYCGTFYGSGTGTGRITVTYVR